MADAGDAPAFDPDVRFDDAMRGVQNQPIGDYQIEALGIKGEGGLGHSIADHLATAEFHLIPISAAFDHKISLHFDEKFGIRKADLVANGRAEGARVISA